jgi:hypothetical protein
MSEDDSIVSQVRGLATDWLASKRRSLQAEPVTKVDKSSRTTGYTFDGQEIGLDELRDIKRVRESGGIVSQLIHAKALLNFGTNISIEVEDEQVAIINDNEVTLEDWLHDTFDDLDMLALELGEDAIWYPYAAVELVENRAGGFSKVLPIEPWTLTPETDEQGRIIAWTQTTWSDSGQMTEQTLSPDDIAHFTLNKSSARDEVGISEVLRNMEEIEAWKQNQRAVMQAIDLHGFPQRHVKVGREGGAPIRDDELRRVRTIFDPNTTDANTAYFTGQDVNIDTLEAHSFDFAGIQEMSLTALTASIGMPLEAANIGSDGLGSGMPAQVRMNILKLQVQANQTNFARQLLDNIIRPVVRDYSPFDHNAHIHLNFDSPLEDMSERTTMVQQVGNYMTTNEAREQLDLAPKDELEGQYGPATTQTEEEETEETDVLFTLETYDDYPQAARDNAQKALDWREEHGDEVQGGTQVGWTRANQLASGESISRETIGRMAAFRRHEDNSKIDPDKEGKPWTDAGYVAWLLWGGDEGISWAERKLDQLEEGKQNQDFSDIEYEMAADWDEPLLEAHAQIWHNDSNERILGITSGVTPDFVKDRIRESIFSGAIFETFDSIPSSKREEFKQRYAETLTQDEWKIDDVTEMVQEFDPSMEKSQAETIARTETASIVNTAREEGYTEMGQGDDRFYWTGVIDNRTTDACEWLINKTNPNNGGTPVSMSELKDLIEEAPTHDDDMNDDLARPDDFVVHPNERKTFVRFVDG